jgi:hypothetical protein
MIINIFIILRKIRQKIPSNIRNLVKNEVPNFSIPEKIYIFGHFHLKTAPDYKIFLKILVG